MSEKSRLDTLEWKSDEETYTGSMMVCHAPMWINFQFFAIICNHIFGQILSSLSTVLGWVIEKRGHHRVKMRLRDLYREYEGVGYTNITQFSMSCNNMKSPSWSDRYFRHRTTICNLPRVFSVVWKVGIAWPTRTDQFTVMTCFASTTRLCTRVSPVRDHNSPVRDHNSRAKQLVLVWWR